MIYIESFWLAKDKNTRTFVLHDSICEFFTFTFFGLRYFGFEKGRAKQIRKIWNFFGYYNRNAFHVPKSLYTKH